MTSHIYVLFAVNQYYILLGIEQLWFEVQTLSPWPLYSA